MINEVEERIERERLCGEVNAYMTPGIKKGMTFANKINACTPYLRRSSAPICYGRDYNALRESDFSSGYSVTKKVSNHRSKSLKYGVNSSYMPSDSTSSMQGGITSGLPMSVKYPTKKSLLSPYSTHYQPHSSLSIPVSSGIETDCFNIFASTSAMGNNGHLNVSPTCRECTSSTNSIIDINYSENSGGVGGKLPHQNPFRLPGSKRRWSELETVIEFHPGETQGDEKMDTDSVGN